MNEEKSGFLRSYSLGFGIGCVLVIMYLATLTLLGRESPRFLTEPRPAAREAPGPRPLQEPPPPPEHYAGPGGQPPW